MRRHSTSRVQPIARRKAANGQGSCFWSPSRNAWLASYSRGLDELHRPIVKRFRAPTEHEARTKRDTDRARWEAMRLLGQTGPFEAPLVPLDLPRGREFVRLNDAAFRRWIYSRDHGRCSLCHEILAFEEMHVDHIRPRIEGGNDHVSNLRISHPACNLKRSARRKRRVDVR